MDIDPSEKLIGNGKIEKHILRKAFDFQDDPYLPKDILWRQKEQFSDGVGYGWIDALIEHTSSNVSDEKFAKRNELFPIDPPQTKEAFYYRRIFEQLFQHPHARKTVAVWQPTWGKSKDPSGRAQKLHSAHDGTK